MKESRKGLKVLITAGPTREHLDPVRFLSNPSTGKMGYALAEAAHQKGYRVTLISGPSSLPTPRCRRFVRVTSAQEMYRAVMKETPSADLMIMTAAVSDYRPARYFPRKIKKTGRRLSLPLIPTADILKELGRRKRTGQVLVGFAAETDHLIRNARKKLCEKNLDLIVANRVGTAGGGFESDWNQVVLITSQGERTVLSRMSKKRLAVEILRFLQSRSSRPVSLRKTSSRFPTP